MFLTTPNPPHERQLLILRIPVPDDQPPIDVMASVVRRHSLARERVAGRDGHQFLRPHRGEQESLGGLPGETPRRGATLAGGEQRGEPPTFLLQPRDLGRLQLFEARDFAQGSMFLRTPVLREIGETIKVMLLHPITDEEFPLLRA